MQCRVAAAAVRLTCDTLRQYIPWEVAPTVTGAGIGEQWDRIAARLHFPGALETVLPSGVNQYNILFAGYMLAHKATNQQTCMQPCAWRKAHAAMQSCIEWP